MKAHCHIINISFRYCSIPFLKSSSGQIFDKSKSFFSLVVIFFLSLANPILPDSLYEEAYEMETSNTLFAIPLYEKALAKKPSGKLQKAIVTRLFFLYKKHGKILDGLFLNSKYSGYIASSDKSWIWSALLEFYKPISSKDLNTTYLLAIKSNIESSTELEDWLVSQNQPKLVEFTSVILMKRKEFRLLKQVLLKVPGILISPIYLGIANLKLKDDSSKEYIKNLISDETTLNNHTADVLYLMGMYYRSLEDYNLSSRYFRMSGSYGPKERAVLEATKSIALRGSYKEICSTFTFPKSVNDEIWNLLYMNCLPNREEMISPLRNSIKILSEKEGNEFLKKLFLGVTE